MRQEAHNHDDLEDQHTALDALDQGDDNGNISRSGREGGR
jgi:hypothetical protein